MRQVFNVVAVNFEDLLQLKQAVRKVLDGLLHLPGEDRDASITFRWDRDEWSIVVESDGSNQRYAWRTPQGVSTADWVRLVSEELENHLLSGSRFILKELAGDVARNHFVFYLERT